MRKRYIDVLIDASKKSFEDGRILDMDEQNRTISKYLHIAYLQGKLVWKEIK